MENIKAQLKTLYKAHAPDKVDLIDSLLEKYKGKEKQFYVSEKAKYSKKSSITDSKKILEAAMARIAAQKKAKTPAPKPEIKKPKVAEVKPTKKITPTPIVSPKLEEEKILKSEKEDRPIPVSTSIKKEKTAPKKEEVTTQNDTKELDNLKKAKARLAENKKQVKPKKKKKKSFVWIILMMVVVLLLILLSFLYLNYFNTEEETIVETIKVEETTAISEPENTTSEEKTSSIVEKDITEENVSENNQNSAIESPKEQSSEETIHPTADRLYAKDIPKTSVFVSCFAVKTEKAAQKKIAVLEKYKLKAHYYWIPDIDHQGNSFFKVVVGPFNNIKSAYPSLTTVQERINFDAYILTIK